MRWEDERYVRIYTRDTVDWLSLSFIAQGLFCLILRKVDRAGLMKLGKHGHRAVAVMVGFPGEWPRLEPALDELLADGCIEIRGDVLLVPNFIEAQEATQSDAQRKRESRARARDIAAAAEALNPDKTSDSVTGCPENGQKVTSGHGASQVVTPCRAVPNQPSLLSSEEVETSPLVSFLAATYPDIKDPWACDRAWSAAYPGVDLLAEALAAKAWETANPKKAKSDHAAFLNRWLKKAAKDAQAKAPTPSINGDRFWDYLTPEEREQYRRERTAIDPELAEAPFGATGVKHEAAVVQLHRRWAELVSWKARTA